jgi:hydrogenase maturation protease
VANLNAAIAVIGCGNANRRDDGVGPYVIELLRDRVFPDDVALFDAGTDGMGVMYRARGVLRLIIVDAKAPEDEPGAIYEVPGEVLEMPPPESFNLHDFRWDHALYAGRRIYGEQFPQDVAVLLIEAGSVDYGLDLTAEVERAAVKVADRIEAMVRRDGSDSLP